MNQNVWVGIELNNIGVQLLHSHRYQQAADTFQEAIEALKHSIDHDSRGDTRSDNIDSVEDSRILEAQSRLLHQPMNRNQALNSSEGLNITPQERRVHFAVGAPSSSSACWIDFNKKNHNGNCLNESTIVLYNTALTHHIYGTLSENVVSLHKALTLYRMALEVLSSATDISDEQIEIKTKLVYLNILDKIGRISYKLECFSDAAHYFQAAAQLSSEDFESSAPAA